MSRVVPVAFTGERATLLATLWGRALDAESPNPILNDTMAAEAVAVPNDAVAALRARHGLAADSFVVGSFGLVTREKRAETFVRAVARAAADSTGSPACGGPAARSAPSKSRTSGG